jgi:hypothetical protein
MQPRPRAQKGLFEDVEVECQHHPQLEPEVRAQVMQLMVQWMQSLALAINQEVDDEQDHR